ncbi:TPA: type 1 fimbrial protein [Salmonella enterica subsp. enterica serovar Mokola]|nr:type 1 fimbrial protein [Salmonella enterica subsp. enterica serovar Mokola]HDA4107514.1 type 1 fimbrial protein [Salmonella enterica subsp. enterica serovar Mokola]HDA4157309.1 type 1 fimbrial protein [Salmonella enterica subsp. enterica serovar Mokola]HDA4179840.1 type 1 fimbrial protein [Salmonella enterica subsp. enterica serovar Mokola]HDA4562573.1 type 1 fimbrial protein [Salmonella enterica subsp. enterica serovar Mokola]
MPGVKHWCSVAAGILLVSHYATAEDVVTNVDVNFGNVTLPVGQEKNVSDYFSQNQKDINLPPPRPAGAGNTNEISWKAVVSPYTKGTDNSYLFELPGISGISLRIQPLNQNQKPSPPDSGETVTFGLVKSGEVSEAGSFGLPGPVFERIVTEKNGAGEILNTTTTQFTLRGNVVVPGCEFAQPNISVEMPQISRQRLEQAAAGEPAGGGKTVNVGFRCAAQKNAFLLKFSTGSLPVLSQLLPAMTDDGGQSGVGFLVKVGQQEQTADWGGKASIPVTLDDSRQLPLTIYYSRDGKPVSEGHISAKGMISLNYP